MTSTTIEVPTIFAFCFCMSENQNSCQTAVEQQLFAGKATENSCRVPDARARERRREENLPAGVLFGPSRQKSYIQRN